ncbi:hypothetical protein [Streptomyces sporangiiformans]
MVGLLNPVSGASVTNG